MKKLLATIGLLSYILLALTMPFIVNAQYSLGVDSFKPDTTRTDKFSEDMKKKEATDDFLKEAEKNAPKSGSVEYLFDPSTYSKAFDQENLKYVSNLPNESKETIISGFIQKILGLGAILAAASVIGAAGYYMISMGNEDDMGKAKNILLYTIIGLAIMSGAYGIVVGIAKIQLF